MSGSFLVNPGLCLPYYANVLGNLRQPNRLLDGPYLLSIGKYPLYASEREAFLSSSRTKQCSSTLFRDRQVLAVQL